jgi:hypothetical protein
VRCSFAVRSDLKAVDGQPVEGGAFSFTTGGPAVIEHLPYRHDLVDEEQIFILGWTRRLSRTRLSSAYCDDAKGVTEEDPRSS